MLPVLNCLHNFIIYLAAYSDTDSEWSSLERRQNSNDFALRMSKKSSNSHKRTRKKRSVIPVQPPRVPPINLFHSNPPAGKLLPNNEVNNEKLSIFVSIMLFFTKTYFREFLMYHSKQ